MQTPISAFRGRSNGSEKPTFRKILIPVTRGNSDLLAIVAKRVTELQALLVKNGSSALRETFEQLGALVLSLIPVHHFVVRYAAIECQQGRSPRLTLTGAAAGETLVLSDLDFAALAEEADIPPDRAIGEIACPNCHTVNTRVALRHALDGDGCCSCCSPGRLMLPIVRYCAAGGKLLEHLLPGQAYFFEVNRARGKVYAAIPGESSSQLIELDEEATGGFYEFMSSAASMVLAGTWEEFDRDSAVGDPPSKVFA